MHQSSPEEQFLRKFTKYIHARFKWNSRAHDSDVFYFLRKEEEELVNAKNFKQTESPACTKFCATVHGRSRFASVHDHANFIFWRDN